MDTERVRLSQERTCKAQMINSLDSSVSSTVEPVFMQEYKGSLMQYPAQSAQIGQQITQIILTSPDSQTLLVRVAKALGEIFQVDVCLVAAGINPAVMLQYGLWQADGCRAIPPDHQVQLLKNVTLGDNSVGEDLLAIPDLQASDICQAVSEWREVLPTRAVLKTYTRFQSVVNGVIVLGRSHPHQWTRQEQELLSVASPSIAIAFSQVQLTAQVVAATRHQTLINQLCVATRSGLDLDEIFDDAIAGTTQALQVDRGLLLLLKHTSPSSKSRQPSKSLSKIKVTVVVDQLQKTGSHLPQHTSTRTLLNKSFWLSESPLCKQAFNNAPEPLIIDHEPDAPTVDTSTESLSILEREMMPGVLIVPLVSTHSNAAIGASVLGFLVLQHKRSRPWQANEIELVKWVSAQMSAAIIQNQTLRQVQSLVEDRTAQLQQSLEIQAKLYEKTRQQIDQLQQLNLLKEEFMSTMSHELRTPLTSMSLAIRMLRQPTLPSERRAKYLSILEQECNKEIELINDLLSLQRLEGNQAHIQPQQIDLMSVINELAQSFEEKWADKRLTLTVESSTRSRRAGEAQSLMLNTDPDSLNRILLELLTNAGKYADPDTTVCLRVTHQVHNSVNQVVLTLSNMGAGILPTDLTHIFDKFYRGQGVTQQAVKGTGLGLALVKCLVQHLNGTIDVESRPFENSQTCLTSFTVTLPSLNSSMKV